MWLLIVVVCTIHIWSIDRSNKWLFYFTKTTPILLMSLVVFSQSATALDHYSFAIGIALLLSSVGDLFLMHPKDKFIPGLVAFLCAHIVYSVAFLYPIEHISSYWTLFTLMALGMLVYLLLLPGLGGSKFPVAIYTIAILLMVWSAIEFWTLVRIPSAGYAMFGAFIFVISDIVLAIDRFRSSSAFSRHVVMITYYTAQALLTLSAVT